MADVTLRGRIGFSLPFLLLLLGGAVRPAEAEFVPAAYVAGAVPSIQVAAVGGGEVFLEVLVSAAGAVKDVRVVRATPPFTMPLVDAVRTWRFAPAQDDVPVPNGGPAPATVRMPVESTVFVAAEFRPPALESPTLGQSPAQIADGQPDAPTALVSVMPNYPPMAAFEGVVLTEGDVAADGMLVNTVVIRSVPPFDRAALDALGQWHFRPARVRGRTVATRVYVVFGFPQPVTTGR